jgi:hypothetical protein
MECVGDEALDHKSRTGSKAPLRDAAREAI